MEQMNDSPQMTQCLSEQRLFAREPFSLIDVGASGGIASYWRVFGEFFKAFAFEPLVAECERLNSHPDKLKTVTYFPYFVVADDPEVRAASGHIYASKIFKRTSANKATTIKKINYIQDYFNSGVDPVYTDQQISLSEFFSSKPEEPVDFIKIDTDGNDYEVLHGAKDLIANKRVLGVMIESQFHGKAHPHSNTFRNIDRLLVDMGFSLFDLDVYRYTKSDLPGIFSLTVPAQTTTGRVLSGDALYFRDVVANSMELSPIKLLKLTCLFELFGLSDCAAELFNTYRDSLSPIVDVQKCLDLLVKNLKQETSYATYCKKFEDDLESFYPSQASVVKRRTRLLSMLKKVFKV